jgi:hypothetical protein
MFPKILAVYSENQKKFINTASGGNGVFPNIKAGGTYNSSL